MLSPLDPAALLLLAQLGAVLTIYELSCEEFDKKANKVKKCGFRHEIQYDFAELFIAQACVNNTYCLCKKTIYVRYIPYPPYVYKKNTSGLVEGLLPGMFRFLCIYTTGQSNM